MNVLLHDDHIDKRIQVSHMLDGRDVDSQQLNSLAQNDIGECFSGDNWSVVATSEKQPLDDNCMR